MLEKIFKFSELRRIIPLSRSTLWRKVKSGEFPKPISLGGNSPNTSRGWLESDVKNWIEKQKNKNISSEDLVSE